MAEFPAMPLWTDAYLADTSHLTTIEHGAYLLLLMVMWRTREKSLPDDDKLLARYAKLTPAQWRKLKPVLSDFFTIKNGRWNQSRLTDEANAVKRHRERQAKAGMASALKRKERHSTTVQPKSNQRATPTPTPTPIPSPNGDGTRAREPKSKPRTAKTAIPRDWSPEQFGEGSKCRAIMDRWSAAKHDTEIERFTAHHTAKGSRFENWQAAWKTWVLNSEEFTNERQRGASSRDRRDGFTRAIHDELGFHDPGHPASETGRRDTHEGRGAGDSPAPRLTAL